MKHSYWKGFLSGITVLSVGFSVLMIGSGFQGASLKIGVVDPMTVQQAMEGNKSMAEDLNKMVSERQAVLEYLDRYRVIKKADAEKFKTLSLKANKTDAEKAELEKVKTYAQDQKKKFEDLQLKPAPTAEELKQLDDVRSRQAEIGDYLNTLNTDFQQELKAKQNAVQKSALDTYTNSVKEVAKKQGFTIIFDKNVAPYGANDITDDVAKTAIKK